MAISKKTIALTGIVALLAITGWFATKDKLLSNGSSDKEVTIAVINDEKPLSYKDANGNQTGYEIEAIKAIEKKIAGYRFNIVAVDEDSLEIGLDSGKYALISEGLFKTKERLQKYILPTQNTGVSLIKIAVKSNNNSIHTLDDLVGKNIAPVSPNGGIFNLLTDYNKSHDKKITITAQEGLSLADRYRGVAEGKYDATVLPAAGFDEIKSKLKLDIKQTDPIKVNYTYFVLRKDQKDLADKVDIALADIKKDGTLSKLAVKYYGEDILKYQAK